MTDETTAFTLVGGKINFECPIWIVRVPVGLGWMV